MTAKTTRDAHGFTGGQPITLVAGDDPGDLGKCEFKEDTIDGGDVLLVIRIAGVDDVDQ
jgi:hypothetical protein